MTPPFAVPAITVEPGGKVTFAGTASDDQGLKDVEITLRNSSTGENLGNDCTWGTTVQAGNCRVSPVDISGSNYNWTWTTPFNLTPGTYSFTVRATDDEELTTASGNQGRLTINATYAGDLRTGHHDGLHRAYRRFPDGEPCRYGHGRPWCVERARLAAGPRHGSLPAGQRHHELDARPSVNATLGTPGGTSTTWSLPAITLPTGGNWRFTATAYDAAHGQQDASPATGSYTIYPGDGPPALSDTLGQPQNDASFTDGVIVVTGSCRGRSGPVRRHRVGAGRRRQLRRAVDELDGHVHQHHRELPHGLPQQSGQCGVELLIHDAGDPGRDLQRARASGGRAQPDRHRADLDQRHGDATGEQPAGCQLHVLLHQNVCTFDGRGSTDENPASLTYTWNFGTSSGSTVNGSGPLPTRTFTSPSPAGAPFQVTLTVRDQWTVTNTSAPQSVTIVEPSGNSAPVPTFIQSCTGLTCSVNSSGTADPNTGDTIAYSWNWGDGTAVSTGAAPAAHTYAASGSYVITLTTTDGWGKFASTARGVTLSEPAGNRHRHRCSPRAVRRTRHAPSTARGPSIPKATRSGTRGTSVTPARARPRTRRAPMRRPGRTRSPSRPPTCGASSPR